MPLRFWISHSGGHMTARSLCPEDKKTSGRTVSHGNGNNIITIKVRCQVVHINIGIIVEV